ncbi:MAG: hypothetical protein GVY09_10540 [Gammaproteobacteria bacterium]|jgi:hypothetical protein|nr:hypothetical protein [Gammaproteobacteria bacterium]
MSEQSRQQSNGRPTAPNGELPHLPSGRRRHLLKAAASAGPLIATLPSGEALAAASALQCVINEQNNTEPPDGVVSNTLPDNYIRIPGKRQLYRSTTAFPAGFGIGTVEVYLFNDQAGNPVHIVGDNQPPQATDLAPTGTWFVPPDPPNQEPTFEEDVLFLRMYDANPNPITGPNDVAIDETGADANGPYPSERCTIDNPPGGWNTVSAPPPTAPRSGPIGTNGRDCVYPLAVQADPNVPGNIPLTGSCLTSFTGL